MGKPSHRGKKTEQMERNADKTRPITNKSRTETSRGRKKKKENRRELLQHTGNKKKES